METTRARGAPVPVARSVPVEASPADLTNRPLFDAVWRCDLEEVQTLLNQGSFDVNAFDVQADGRSPLMKATYRGNLDIINALLEHDADVHATDGEGRTALMVAVSRRYNRDLKLQILEALLNDEADVDHVDGNGETALMIVARQGPCCVLEWLLSNGADINQQCTAGKTPLFYAARTGTVEGVRVLIEKGAVINHMDHYGSTPLVEAASAGKSTAFDIIEENGGDIQRSIPRHGGRFLNFAVTFDRRQLFDLIIRHKARINGYHAVANEALLTAAREKNHHYIVLLLRNGADVNAVDESRSPSSSASESESESDFGKTALMVVASQSDTKSDIIETLIKSDANVNAKANGKTALHMAVSVTNLGVVISLLQNGADVNATDRNGRTALMMLVSGSCGFPRALSDSCEDEVAIIEALLDGGANVDAIDREEKTALMIAVSQSRSPPLCIIKALIDGGADMDAIDIEEKTALMIAVSGTHSPPLCIIKALIDGGADMELVDGDGQTALMMSTDLLLTDCLLGRGATNNIIAQLRSRINLWASAAHGYSNIINAFLGSGTDINDRNEERETCLMKVASSNLSAKEKVRMVDYLMDKGANINLQDNKGQTALIIAATKGVVAAVKELLKYKPNLKLKNKEGKTALEVANGSGIQNILQEAAGTNKRQKR